MENLGITLNYLLIIGVLSLIIVFLVINIFNVYERGSKNLELIQSEEEKLNHLIAEQKELQENVEYYKSLKFVESYAKENLGLGERNENLYKIDREEEQVYDLQEKNTDPILLDDNSSWWKRIFLW